MEKKEEFSELNELKHQLAQRQEQIAVLQKELNGLYASRSWKLSKPVRVAGKCARKVLPKKVKSALRSLVTVKKHSTQLTVEENFVAVENTYENYAAIFETQRNVTFTHNIKFSIAVPLYNTDEKFLKEMILSVMSQSYQNWELCLLDASDASHEYVGKICKNAVESDSRILYKKSEKSEGISGNTNMAISMATGEYIALLDHDDLLAPDALYENAKAIDEKKAEVLYSDEIHLSESGEFVNPFYKPDWSPDLLYSQNYVCHFLVVKKELVSKLKGIRKEFDGAQDYDFILRLSEETSKIHHISKILYIWRESTSSTAANADSKPYAHDAGKKALDEHLKKIYGVQCHADDGRFLFTYDARFSLKSEPLVSIIIPMKDKWELTNNCIESILQKTSYSNYEILILDNRSTQKETFEWFKKVKAKDCRIRILKARMRFNWSKINNFGIKKARGELYVFLNNDTLIISEDWLQRLAENALRKDVGVVGAQLLYEDNTIQHAGVVLGIGGYADHVFKGMQPVHNGTPFVSSQLSRNVLAVTGACMAISKNVIQKIGGFDKRFIICGSDVEICLRAHEAGLYNRYDASVMLYHLESKSRDSYIPKIDFKMSERCYAPYINHKDPFFNMNLELITTPKEQLNMNNNRLFSAGHYFKLIYSHLKNDGFLRTVELAARKLQVSEGPIDGNAFKIPEVSSMNVRKSNIKSEKIRINLLVPSIRKSIVFGGISTALRFYYEMIERSGFEGRIITTDDDVDIMNSVQIDGYEVFDASTDSDAPYQILPFGSRFEKTMPVRDNDIFIATAWWTAYNAEAILRWQAETFGKEILPLIYLVQDYEPGFYAWSSRYMLADSTYKMNIPVFAVFNSSLLKSFFDKNGYNFKKNWVFDPKINTSLKEHLAEVTQSKKKQILIYGRPNVPRNAFELILMALNEWCDIYEECKDWKILSAGETHKDILLKSGQSLSSIGKLSLEEYAKTMLETYAGISLMVSPHPSYPPLEMATFGIKTITNCYANKDLSDFNENIVSLNSCSATDIAKALKKICEEYSGVGTLVTNSEYVNKIAEFDNIPSEIIDELKGKI